MAAAKKSTPTYVWPEYPDDPTLGGAITAEMHDNLQSGGDAPVDDDDSSS